MAIVLNIMEKAKEELRKSILDAVQAICETQAAHLIGVLETQLRHLKLGYDKSSMDSSILYDFNNVVTGVNAWLNIYLEGLESGAIFKDEELMEQEIPFTEMRSGEIGKITHYVNYPEHTGKLMVRTESGHFMIDRFNVRRDDYSLFHQCRVKVWPLARLRIRYEEMLKAYKEWTAKELKLEQEKRELLMAQAEWMLKESKMEEKITDLEFKINGYPDLMNKLNRIYGIIFNEVKAINNELPEQQNEVLYQPKNSEIIKLPHGIKVIEDGVKIKIPAGKKLDISCNENDKGEITIKYVSY